MDNSRCLIKAIEALGTRIYDLEVALSWKDSQIEELKKKLAEKEGADGKN